MIILPAIDLLDGQCVRLRQGRFEESTVFSSDPLAVAAAWEAAGAEWIHVVDLNGARDGRACPANSAALGRIAADTGVRIQYGGGIRTLEALESAYGAGVSRVVLGTVAARDPALLGRMLERHGDRIAIGLDARNDVVAVDGWQEHVGEASAAFGARMIGLGAVRFVCTDIGRDGTLAGPNLEWLAAIAQSLPSASVIASGGIGCQDDVGRLMELRRTTAPNLEGAIVGRALYTGDVDLRTAVAAASRGWEAQPCS